jgi:hypothetical protein
MVALYCVKYGVCHIGSLYIIRVMFYDFLYKCLKLNSFANEHDLASLLEKAKRIKRNEEYQTHYIQYKNRKEI